MFFDSDGRPDDSDKSGGIEYFLIGDPDKWTAVAEHKLNYSVADDLPFTENTDKPF
jgi:hypothetical protein